MRASWLLLCVLLAACKPQHTTPHNIASPPTAQAAAQPPPQATTRVLRLELGNAIIAGQHRVVTPLLQFSPHDTFYASAEVASNSAAQPHQLGVRWTHLDSKQIILEEQQTLRTATTTFASFQLSKADAWPSGQYKVEILLDGRVVQTRLFEVVQPTPTAK